MSILTTSLTKDLPLRKASKEDDSIPEDYANMMAGGHYGVKRYGSSVYTPLVVCGMITGCGVAQMYGVIYMLDSPDADRIFKQVRKDFIKGKGAGGIVCTLGHIYRKKYEPMLFKHGFKLIAEYPNLHHNRNGTEIQAMYMLN